MKDVKFLFCQYYTVIIIAINTVTVVNAYGFLSRSEFYNGYVVSLLTCSVGNVKLFPVAV